MKKDPAVFLKHILESIAWIEKEAGVLTEEQFKQNVPTQDVVIRRLEIIGEAIRNLPDDFKKMHPEIPWDKPMAMRNILIHNYFGVDLNIVWDTITQTLPEFKKQIKSLPELSKDEP